MITLNFEKLAKFINSKNKNETIAVPLDKNEINELIGKDISLPLTTSIAILSADEKDQIAIKLRSNVIEFWGEDPKARLVGLSSKEPALSNIDREHLKKYSYIAILRHVDPTYSKDQINSGVIFLIDPSLITKKINLQYKYVC